MILKSFQEPASIGSIVWVNLKPCINEGTDQPSPNRTLMIRGISRAKITIIPRFVVGFARSKRSQPDGSEQSLFRNIDHRAPTRFVQHWVVQRNRQQLIGPAGSIGPTVFTVDHVVKVPPVFVPETGVERLSRLCRMRRHAICLNIAARIPQTLFQNSERVIPERIDLYSLSPARSDHPAVHLCIHPGELIALLSLNQQPVVAVDMNVEKCSAQVISNDVQQLRKKLA